MSNRAAKFVSAAYASILTAGLLAAVSLGGARAADDCLAAPNAPTAGGSHWYYRIDRATKRHCWYLREQSEKLSQSRAPSSRSTMIVGQGETTAQRSVADAHAELTAPSVFEQPVRTDAQVAAMPAEAHVGESREAAPQDALVQPSMVGSRWPDPSAVTSQVSPAVMPSSSPPAPDTTALKLAANSAAAPTSDVAATPPAAAEPISLAHLVSIPLVLAAIAAASALAAIIGTIILKFGGTGRSRQPQIRTPRRVNWEWTDDDRTVTSGKSAANFMPRRSGFESDLHTGDGNRRAAADPLSQFTRRAPS
jgi:hypothetical protein